MRKNEINFIQLCKTNSALFLNSKLTPSFYSKNWTNFLNTFSINYPFSYIQWLSSRLSFSHYTICTPWLNGSNWGQILYIGRVLVPMNTLFEFSGKINVDLPVYKPYWGCHSKIDSNPSLTFFKLKPKETFLSLSTLKEFYKRVLNFEFWILFLM